jgi:hypothetical protein
MVEVYDLGRVVDHQFYSDSDQLKSIFDSDSLNTYTVF